MQSLKMSQTMMNAAQELIAKQQALIRLQEEQLKKEEERNQKIRDLISDWENSYTTLEDFYAKLLQDSKKKVPNIEKYAQFIDKHGSEKFTGMFLDSCPDWIPNFREFTETLENENLKEKINVDISNREQELTRRLYQDYMSLMPSTSIVNAIAILHEDLGKEFFDNLDTLIV